MITDRLYGLSSPEGSAPKTSYFTTTDAEGIQYPHNDPIVVSLNIDDCNVHRVLVDTGSSMNLLSYDAFVRMKLKPEQLRRVRVPLEEFFGRTIPIEGIVDLSVIAGIVPCQVRLNLIFAVVRNCSAYNAILG